MNDIHDSFKDQIQFIKDNNLSTPVAFYDERLLDRPFDLMKSCLGESTKILFALKSSYNTRLLQSLSSRGIGVEVMSELEYELAKKNGYKAIVLNGMGRSMQLLSEAINDGSTIIVDTATDIQNVKEIAKTTTSHIKLGIRLRVLLEDYAQMNSYVNDGHPLGNALGSPVFDEFLRYCKQSPQIEWEMLHMHVAINEIDIDIYQQAMNYASTCLKQVEATYGLVPRVINLGGGYEVYDSALDAKFRRLFESLSAQFGKIFDGLTLAVEPGRYLSASAGYTIGTVQDVKYVGSKAWLITDVSTNTLIPIPNARYKLALPYPTKRAGVTIGITDGITSPANSVVDEAVVDAVPEIGSAVVIANTGAYTDVYSTFWAYAPHKVCFISKTGEYSLSRTDEDIQNLKDIYLH